MIRRSHEFENIDGSIRVGRQCVAQVGIEVGQARTVNDQIQVLLQMARRLGAESEAWLGDIPFDDLDLVAQKAEKPVAVALKQRIEHRRVFHHLLEAPVRGIRLLPADQQVDPFHVGQVQKRIRQPDLADEPGNADQHHLLSRKCPANGKSRSLPLALKMDDGPRRSPPAAAPRESPPPARLLRKCPAGEPTFSEPGARLDSLPECARMPRAAG